MDSLNRNEEGMIELVAIHLNTVVNGSKKVQELDFVVIENGWLISGDHGTHKVIGCYGTIDSSRLEMMVTDVITNEPIILKLK